MADSRVAILGATGHVGRVLCAGLAGRFSVTLYARRPEAALAFARSLSGDGRVHAKHISTLSEGRHDVVVNCIGIGDPAAVNSDPSLVYTVTQYSDDVAMSYLAAHPDARLINLSSGAAYCSDFSRPASADTTSDIPANGLVVRHHYGLAKLASEGRHRAATSAAIVDLRLFSLFSRFIDPRATYLMNDVVGCISSGDVLITGPDDFWRDYVAPEDLASLVARCIEAPAENRAYDVYSLAPVRKFELLQEFSTRFALAYRVDEVRGVAGDDQWKAAYYSLDHSAGSIGYTPTMTSLETLAEEVAAILGSVG